MNRRGFLGTMLAAAMAPAIVRAQSLMPVRQIAAPSSSAAVMDYWLKNGYDGHVLDAVRYGLGVVELFANDGRVLAKMNVTGQLINGAHLDVEPTFVAESGVFKEAFLNVPKFGRFKIDLAHTGSVLTPGMEVVCEAGLNVTMDPTAELVASGRLPGVLISA